jgi:uncharacterized protein YdbL (DUF1318 family)
MSLMRWITAGLAAFCLALAACVTINVYFPAAAAEKAADRIIEDIWGPGKGPNPEGSSPQGALIGAPGDILLASLQGALDFVIPRAEAQADLDISSPAIRTLTASMKGRAGTLDPFFASGAIGLTSDGLVEVRDANAVALAERNRLKKLVADENGDRNALYREIATANGHADWEKDIRSTFAERWIANARAGWYYQDKSGAWKKK